MKKLESKLERLSRFEQLLLAHPEGLTRAELARRLGTHRSTIGRYLTDTRNILPTYEKGNRIGLNRDGYLNNIRLNIHEIMVLHLCSRLFACRTDKFNPHACSAMRKMGQALSRYSETISGYIKATAEHLEKEAGKHDEYFIPVLEKLTRGWSDGLWLHLAYFSQKDNEVHEYDFAPYLIEPYAVGFTIYTLGLCRQKNQVITLKVERIRKAELLKEKFEIPGTFDPEELLKNAWGIWYSENDPIEVELEFSAAVAGRVKETVWHKSQVLEVRANGGLVWKAQIAEPLELYNWIRGWGSDVRIIKPDSLRERMRDEVKKLGEMYGV